MNSSYEITLKHFDYTSYVDAVLSILDRTGGSTVDGIVRYCRDIGISKRDAMLAIQDVLISGRASYNFSELITEKPCRSAEKTLKAAYYTYCRIYNAETLFTVNGKVMKSSRMSYVPCETMAEVVATPVSVDDFIDNCIDRRTVFENTDISMVSPGSMVRFLIDYF